MRDEDTQPAAGVPGLDDVMSGAIVTNAEAPA
jgi:hypothetical protein